MELSAYASQLIFGYLVVVARIGSALMFMPAFGEMQFPIRGRIAFALVLCAALYPAIPNASWMPSQPLGVALLLATEVTLGLWMGLAARVLLAAMQFAGNQIGQIIGLANAFGPSFGAFEGATMVATLLLMGSVTVIFATDTHHIILMALMHSYDSLPPGQALTNDLASNMVKAGSHSLYVGTAIAVPFFVMGVILNLGMGLANRMMPQLPVFFVAAPLLIGVGFLVLSVAAAVVLPYFVADFADWIMDFRF